MSTTALRPWYREPWPWLLMVPPLGAVLGGVAMLVLAVGSPEPLVVDDYAHIEDITRAGRAADLRAAELGVGATVTLAHDSGGRARIEVEVETNGVANAPGELALRLRHAARAEADRAIGLERVGSRYVGETDVAAGRYTLEISSADEGWRLSGSLSEVTTLLELKAEPPTVGR